MTMQATNALMRDAPVAAVSLSAFVLVWEIAAAAHGDPSVLPSPRSVLLIAWNEAASGALPMHMAATFARVAAAFVLAMGLGSALGILLGLSPRVDRWANPWVMVFLNMPALVVIVLCYLWIGLTEAAAITAVALNKTAMVCVTIREGVRVRDRSLAEMAAVFPMTDAARLRHILLPQLAPYFAASVRTGLSIIWKIVLVVEFLGRPNGIGFQIHLYFQLFDIGHVLAYSMSFVVVMYLLDGLVISRLLDTPR